MVGYPKPKREADSSYALKKCDHLLYQCLLKRDKKCQRCDSSDFLVPSHCYGKKAWPNMRHELLNNLLLCDDCHKWWHANLKEAWEWFRNKWPQRYIYIRELKNVFVKLNKAHYQKTAKELKMYLEGE